MRGEADPQALTNVDYWDDEWKDVKLPTRFHHRWKYETHCIHKFLKASLPQPGSTILEVGCGASAWLPYFARELGLDVAGLDYSEIGVRLARENLRLHGVTGRVVHGDVFHPPVDLRTFDAVFSWGFVEHFEDVPAAVRAIARFGRPGATIITGAPNFAGWLRHLQKLLDPKDYSAHNPLSRRDLDLALREAGLEITTPSRPIGTFNARAASFPALEARLPRLGRRALKAMRGALNRVVNAPAMILDWAPEGDLLSAHIVSVSRVPLR